MASNMMSTSKKITIIAPDDWHCHLRDDAFLARTVPDTATRFKRAVIMPNLNPPVTTVIQAKKYLQRIHEYIPQGNEFMPLMTLYLTEETSPNTLREAKKSGFIIACKLYPAGVTTHTTKGVRKLTKIYPLLEIMQNEDLLLLIHGESIDSTIDIFDREAVFIDRELNALIQQFPKLRIVLEHISTRYAVNFVKQTTHYLGATITAHHLLLNRNNLLVGGIYPHYYCLPVLKRVQDQAALIAAATSGNAKFFLGTDSAPHPLQKKESSCGCAGIYTAHAAIELYTEIFAQQNALDQLEAFASINGAKFYGLPLNSQTITLVNDSWRVPKTLPFGDQQLIPLRAGETVKWCIEKGMVQ